PSHTRWTLVVPRSRIVRCAGCQLIRDDEMDQEDTSMLVTGKTLGQWFLLAIFGVVLYLCFRIMQPFLIPIFLALILSTLLDPVYEALARRMGDGRTLASLAVCLGLTLTIVLPVLLLSIALAREANDIYQNLRD